MDSAPKSPSRSIDSGRGSSSGNNVIGNSMDSVRSISTSPSISRLSLVSQKSDSDAADGIEQKKKRKFGSLLRKKKVRSISMSDLGQSDLGQSSLSSLMTQSTDCLPQGKKKKLKLSFRKKSKSIEDKTSNSEMTPLDIVPENSIPMSSSSRMMDSETVPTVKTVKKKLSLVQSLRRKIKGTSASYVVTFSSTSTQTSPLMSHLVDLEAEPIRLQSSSRRSSSSTEYVPVEDDNPSEISQVIVLPDLSEPPPITQNMITPDETQVQDDYSSSTAVNYGATAQRMRIKKANLRRETVDRIFRQRQESENENNEDKNTFENGTGDTASKASQIDLSTEEVSECGGVSEPEVEIKEIFQPGNDEVSIAQEYLQQANSETTITVTMVPEPFNLFQKRLSIISETGNDGGLNLEQSTNRRASDFTDSFKKLEPFAFDLPAVIEGKRERLYKVLVVGELGTGKTSIIKRYVHQFFSQHYRATIGVDFALKVLKWDPETVVRLQLWDIAGQERFGSMTRVYYKEAVGAFVVFDVTRGATLDAVPKWKQDLDSKVVLPDGRSIPAVLLANKIDQPREGLAANREKMNEFCQQHGFSAWFETSAKDNINIDESANFLVSKILEMDKWSQEPLSTDPDKVALNSTGTRNGSPNGCAC